jgi:hypothetical protein
VFRQPFLEVREFNGTRFLQRTGRETADPVVMDSKRFRYSSVLPNPGFDRFPGLFNSFFDVHVFYVLTL